MSERTVTVRLNVTDNFSGSLDSYNQKMGQAETTTKQAGDNASDSGSKFGGLGTMIAGAFTVAAAQKIISFGVEMANLGTEVNATKAIFEQLVTPMGDVEDIMARLREATLNTASDNDIRTGANMLMRMNIAENPEELENILAMITRLKSPTEDLGTAINNFSLMMANQSVLRLDSFGLSSGRVRARILELLESGQALDREEAFKMATLEEGARAIERLGSAATTAATPLARLEVAIQNITEDAASNISAGVTGSVGILEIALGMHPEQVRQAEERATRISSDLSTSIVEGLAAKGRGEVGNLSDNFISAYMEAMVTAAIDDPSLANNMEALRLAAIQTLPSDMYYSPTGDRQNDMPAYDQRYAAQLDALSQIGLAQIEVNAQRREGEALVQAEADAAQRASDIEIERLLIAQERKAYANQQNEKNTMLGGLDSIEMDAIAAAFENIDGSANSIASLELPAFMTSEQAERIGAMADDAERMAGEIAAMAEEQPDMFTAEEVENAQATADSVRQMADNAEKAAEAFDRIKLSEIFGQTSGGTFGELSDMIIKSAEEMGMAAEQVAALQSQLDISSGRETSASLYVRETLIPEIAAEADPETVAAMTGKLNDILRAAMLEGVDVNNEDFLAGLREQLSPDNLLGEDFDPEAFVAPFAAVTEETTATAEQTAAISTDISAVGETTPGIASDVEAASKSMTTLGTQTDRFRAKLVETFAKSYSLTIDVKHNAPPWLAALIDAGSFAQAMGQATRDGGGVPPGADSRVNP